MQDSEPQAPFVVASVLVGDASLAAWKEAAGAAGMIELRADLLRGEEIREAVSRAGRPVIVAVRREVDGGRFTGDEAARRSLLLTALSAGARYVDVERSSPLADLADGEHASRVILSDHDASSDAADLESRFRRMAATRASRLKIVLREATPKGVELVRDLLRRQSNRRLTAFCLGPGGEGSRILCLSWGGWGTYGAIARGKETAAGQLTVRDLLETHAVLRLGRGTRRYALVGRGVTASPSPAMHRAGYEATGLDACYIPLELERFEECPAAVRALELEGLAVTVPYKVAAARRAMPGDDNVRRSSAANTIRIAGDGWRAYNTDAPAALALVRRRLDPAGCRVALLGAGGTARALAVVFRESGARVRLFNRTAQRALALSAELGIEGSPLSDLPRAAWDILINATPAGREGESLVDSRHLCGRLVVDVVYGAKPTPLIESARRRGVAAIDGLEMLAAQAVLQFQRLTDRTVPYELLHEAGRRWLAPSA